MKGWITVDPLRVIEIVNQYGKLKVLDETELVVDINDMADFEPLRKSLSNAFGGEIDLELRKE